MGNRLFIVLRGFLPECGGAGRFSRARFSAFAVRRRRRAAASQNNVVVVAMSRGKEWHQLNSAVVAAEEVSRPQQGRRQRVRSAKQKPGTQYHQRAAAKSRGAALLAGSPRCCTVRPSCQVAPRPRAAKK